MDTSQSGLFDYVAPRSNTYGNGFDPVELNRRQQWFDEQKKKQDIAHPFWNAALQFVPFGLGNVIDAGIMAGIGAGRTKYQHDYIDKYKSRMEGPGFDYGVDDQGKFFQNTKSEMPKWDAGMNGGENFALGLGSATQGFSTWFNNGSNAKYSQMQNDVNKFNSTPQGGTGGYSQRALDANLNGQYPAPNIGGGINGATDTPGISGVNSTNNASADWANSGGFSSSHFDFKKGGRMYFSEGGFDEPPVLVHGGSVGTDKIALVNTETGQDTGKRVNEGEMLVVSKDTLDALNVALSKKDKKAVFDLMLDQVKQKPTVKNGLQLHIKGGPTDGSTIIDKNDRYIYRGGKWVLDSKGNNRTATKLDEPAPDSVQQYLTQQYEVRNKIAENTVGQTMLNVFGEMGKPEEKKLFNQNIQKLEDSDLALMVKGYKNLTPQQISDFDMELERRGLSLKKVGDNPLTVRVGLFKGNNEVNASPEWEGSVGNMGGKPLLKGSEVTVDEFGVHHWHDKVWDKPSGRWISDKLDQAELNKNLYGNIENPYTPKIEATPYSTGIYTPPSGKMGVNFKKDDISEVRQSERSVLDFPVNKPAVVDEVVNTASAVDDGKIEEKVAPVKPANTPAVVDTVVTPQVQPTITPGGDAIQFGEISQNNNGWNNLSDGLGYGMDAYRMIQGARGAATDIPQWSRTPEWNDIMGRMKLASYRGFSPEENANYQLQQDRQYASDISNINNMSGGSNAIALGNYGRANTQQMLANLQHATANAQMQRQNLGQYGGYVTQDMAYDRMLFGDKYSEAKQKEAAGAKLFNDAYKNSQERFDFNNAYGTDSLYGQLQAEQLKGLRETNQAKHDYNANMKNWDWTVKPGGLYDGTNPYQAGTSPTSGANAGDKFYWDGNKLVKI